jgi:uncharacterized protein
VQIDEGKYAEGLFTLQSITKIMEKRYIMRRKDREITQMEELLEIMRKCDVCRLALFDGTYPYIVPLNFGLAYNETTLELYFHCAREGKKLDLIRSNPNAAFEMDCSHNLITGDKACDYTMEFESVCGTGKISLLSEDDKINALTHMMRQYSKESSFEFNQNHLKAVTVFKLTVDSITGKKLK